MVAEGIADPEIGAVGLLVRLLGDVDTLGFQRLKGLLRVGGGETRGETDYLRAPDTGPRRTLTRFVGYLGPSGFGLCAAKLIETGHVVTVLWLAIMLLVLLLFLIRKSFAMVSVPLAIALLAYVMRHAHGGLEEIIVYGMT